MKMKMKTKNVKKDIGESAQPIIREVLLQNKENKALWGPRDEALWAQREILEQRDRPIRIMLDRTGILLPVRIDKSNNLENGIIVLNNQNPFLYRNIDILPRLTASATLNLDKNDEDLINLSGSIIIHDPSNLEFQIDQGNEISEDKLRKAIERIQEIQDGGDYNAKLTIYLPELAPEPTKYTLLRKQAARRIRAKQTASEEPADEELSKLRALLESEGVEITKEKGMSAMKLKTYVMKGDNVLVVPSANGNLIVKVQKTNGFSQGVSNGVAGLANGIINGLKRLSGDRVTIDATANKNYKKSFIVVNGKIKKMEFIKIKNDLAGGELNMSTGVGGASKRRRNKNNAKERLRALLIEDGDGIRICEGELTEVRESGNKNNIVFVLRPLDGATVSRKKVNGATVNMIVGVIDMG